MGGWVGWWWSNKSPLALTQSLALSQSTTKHTKWHAPPVMTQISLGIRPVWSESSLSAWRNLLGYSAIHWATAKTDQTGQMSRLIWVFNGHTSFCHIISLVFSYCGSNASYRNKKSAPLPDIRLLATWNVHLSRLLLSELQSDIQLLLSDIKLPNKVTLIHLNPYKPSGPFFGHWQTVQTQIRRRRTRHLIRVFTVC